MRSAGWLIAVPIALAATLAARQAPPRDAWDPDTVAAAEAAVARLGPRRGLEIRPTILTIVPTTQSLAGRAAGIVAGMSGIKATVEQVKRAIQDLGATETALEINVELPADVLFDFDKADIKKEAEPTLENLATLVRGFPRAEVRIEGHTDAKGTSSYNQALSERRAAAVTAWLGSKEGLRGVRFAVRGKGATEPVAPNQKPDGSDDPVGRQKNRRVSIVVKKS
jgi:outer membrane protein OmpA-like peptidoglycan-associated protein